MENKNKPRECMVEDFDTRDGKGNICIYVGGYKLTVPENIYESVLKKFQKHDEQFMALEKEMREFIPKHHTLWGAVAVSGILSKIVDEGLSN